MGKRFLHIENDGGVKAEDLRFGGSKSYPCHEGITKGNFVSLRSDGTIEPVRYTAFPASVGELANLGSNYFQSASAEVNSSGVGIVASGGNTSLPVPLRLTAISVASGAISIGSSVDLDSTSIPYYAAIDMTYVDTEDKFVIFVGGSVVVASVSGSVITVDQIVTIPLSFRNSPKIMFDVVTGQVIVFSEYYDAGTKYTSVLGRFTGGNLGFDVPVEVSLGYFSAPLSNGTLIQVASDGTLWQAILRVVTITAGSLVYGPDNIYTTSIAGFPNTIWEIDSNELLMFHNSSTGKLTRATVSGDTITTTGSTYEYGTWPTQAVYDPLTRTVLINSNSDMTKVVLAGNTPSVSEDFTIYADNYVRQHGINPAPSLGGFLVHTYLTSDSNVQNIFTILPLGVDNTNSETNVLNFLGWAAKDSVGLVCEILTFGAYVTGVSPATLTPNTLYYVDYNGDLTASPDSSLDFVLLGRAISSTEIQLLEMDSHFLPDNTPTITSQQAADIEANKAHAQSTKQSSFVDADLVNGLLTINHATGSQFVHCTITDENNIVVVPDDVTMTDTNNTIVDLSSYGAITGTWNYLISL